MWDLDLDRLCEFPIFGYAASIADVSEPATRATMHHAYGSARALLRADIRERTTVFFGDSLAWIRRREGAPAPLDAPDELAWPFDRGSPFDRQSLDEGGADEYVEIQIIGGISTEMIQMILFDYPPSALVAEQLAAHKIAWDVNPMAKLPPYLADIGPPLPSDTFTLPCGCRGAELPRS